MVDLVHNRITRRPEEVVRMLMTFLSLDAETFVKTLPVILEDTTSYVDIDNIGDPNNN